PCIGGIESKLSGHAQLCCFCTYQIRTCRTKLDSWKQTLRPHEKKKPIRPILHWGLAEYLSVYFSFFRALSRRTILQALDTNYKSTFLFSVWIFSTIIVLGLLSLSVV